MAVETPQVSLTGRCQGAGPATESVGATGNPDGRLEDLSQIIRAYNEVTDKLQRSHESLKDQVARLQMELASTNAKLQRSKRLAALGEMAAGIAHEIRNPLGAIHLYARMLVDDLKDPSDIGPRRPGSAQTAQKIAVAVRGLNAIVTDVLSFARELNPQFESVSVDQLFDRAVETCRPMIVAAGMAIERLDRRLSPPPRFIADPVLMHQAIVNLIRNAVDATSQSSQPGGAGTPVLTLDVRHQETLVLLRVCDNGPGIAETDIDRIFNPFFTTRSTGTGLGLAIVHRIIDAHSGTICVNNDAGAVFELSLPVSQRSGHDQAMEPSPDRSGDVVAQAGGI